LIRICAQGDRARNTLGRHTAVVPTNVHKYIEISLYAQLTPTFFDKTCGRLQGCKIKSLDTLHF